MLLVWLYCLFVFCGLVDGGGVGFDVWFVDCVVFGWLVVLCGGCF